MNPTLTELKEILAKEPPSITLLTWGSMTWRSWSFPILLSGGVLHMCSWISKTNISLITIWTSELQIKSIISFGYDNIGNASKHEIRCVCYKLLARHSLKLNPIAVLASERSNFAGTQEQARQKGPITSARNIRYLAHVPLSEQLWLFTSYGISAVIPFVGGFAVMPVKVK